MGRAPEMEVTPGTCVYVPTGGMIPEGADGVVMVEYCELFSDTEAAVYKPVPVGANIVEAGDDMKEGQKVLEKGTKITPQAIGALAALGITRVRTYCPWKITVISTGDELVAPRETPKPGRCGISTRMGSMRRPGGWALRWRNARCSKMTGNCFWRRREKEWNTAIS